MKIELMVTGTLITILGFFIFDDPTDSIEKSAGNFSWVFGILSPEVIGAVIFIIGLFVIMASQMSPQIIIQTICPRCANSTGAESKFCPECGFPFPEDSSFIQSFAGRLLSGLVQAMLIIAMIGSFIASAFFGIWAALDYFHSIGVIVPIVSCASGFVIWDEIKERQRINKLNAKIRIQKRPSMLDELAVERKKGLDWLEEKNDSIYRDYTGIKSQNDTEICLKCDSSNNTSRLTTCDFCSSEIPIDERICPKCHKEQVKAIIADRKSVGTQDIEERIVAPKMSVVEALRLHMKRLLIMLGIALLIGFIGGGIALAFTGIAIIFITAFIGGGFMPVRYPGIRGDISESQPDPIWAVVGGIGILFMVLGIIFYEIL